MRAILAIGLTAFTLAACNEDQQGPYLDFVGGGFIFNYRNADAYYGFVAAPLRSLPDGSVIEVEFEMPHSMSPFIVTEKATPGVLQYSFRTPQLSGVVKGHPYVVVMRVVDATGKELGRYQRSFHTDVEQASLPDKPLVVGPGYTPNPD